MSLVCEICSAGPSMDIITRLSGHWVCLRCRTMMAYLYAQEHFDWFERAQAHREMIDQAHAAFEGKE